MRIYGHNCPKCQRAFNHNWCDRCYITRWSATVVQMVVIGLFDHLEWNIEAHTCCLVGGEYRYLPWLPYTITTDELKRYLVLL